MAYRSITASGDLFTVAARELGDATQAVRIANLNNLRDFNLAGLVVLLIPNLDESLSGGVPPQ